MSSLIFDRLDKLTSLCSTIVEQNASLHERLNNLEAGKPNIKKSKSSGGMVDVDGIQIHYEIKLIAEKATSLKSFVYKIFTSIVPIKDTYRHNLSGTDSKRADRDSGLSKKKFNCKYVLQLIKAAIEIVPGKVPICSTPKSKSILKKIEREEDEIKKEILSFDRQVVKDVREAISKKLVNLNRLFNHIREGKAVDDKLLSKFNLIQTDIKYSDYQCYIDNPRLFSKLDERFFEAEGEEGGSDSSDDLND